jgi:hypothetical protein
MRAPCGNKEEASTMPTHYPVPKPEAVQDVLGAMVGTDVKVVIEKHPDIDADAPAILAEFVSDQENVGALCLVDHRAAISLGGALVGVPPEVVQQAIDGYKLDDEAIENVREVVNVMAQLFNSEYTPHVRFRELHRQPGKLPDDTSELRRQPLASRAFKVSIDKYATGILSFMLA